MHWDCYTFNRCFFFSSKRITRKKKKIWIQVTVQNFTRNMKKYKRYFYVYAQPFIEIDRNCQVYSNFSATQVFQILSPIVGETRLFANMEKTWSEPNIYKIFIREISRRIRYDNRQESAANLSPFPWNIAAWNSFIAARTLFIRRMW